MTDNPNKHIQNPKKNLTILEDASWKQVQTRETNTFGSSGEIEVVVMVLLRLLSSKAGGCPLYTHINLA